MEAIVLAGGLGTRLGSRLNGVPKPMVKIGDRPFLEILLERLRSAGCERTILSVGYLNEVIRNHFGNTFGEMKLAYSIEESPLGTGGGIRRALGLVKERNVLVLNGDTVLEVDYEKLLAAHSELGADVTISIVERENIARYGGVVADGNKVMAFTEKGGSGSGWINGGVYCLRRDLYWPNNLPEKFSFETSYLASVRPYAFRCTGYFLDIGIPEDLDLAQHELVTR